MFGSIFLLAQYFQIVQGYSPLQAGIRTLPWTAVPMFVAPIAGILSDRIGARPLLVAGMALMSIALVWMAIVVSPTMPYLRVVPAFVMAGVGMSLYFAPVANLVLSAVRRTEEGKASGVNNTVREVGGVFGVAVLASVFSAVGGYASPQLFVNGLSAGPVGGRRGGGRQRDRRGHDPAKQDVVPSVSYLERGEGGRGRPRSPASPRRPPSWPAEGRALSDARQGWGRGRERPRPRPFFAFTQPSRRPRASSRPR